MFDLPPGVYTLELTVTDKTGAVITSRTEKVLHGHPSQPKRCKEEEEFGGHRQKRLLVKVIGA